MRAICRYYYAGAAWVESLPYDFYFVFDDSLSLADLRVTSYLRAGPESKSSGGSACRDRRCL